MHLEDFLKTARPDWGEKNLVRVKLKLRNADIYSAECLMTLVNSGKLNDLMTSSSELRFSAKTLEAWKAVWCLREETEVDELVRLEEEADDLQTQISQKIVKLANITESVKEIQRMRSGDVSNMNHRVKDLWRSRNGFTTAGSSTLKPSPTSSFRGTFDAGGSPLKPKLSPSSLSFCSNFENKGGTTNMAAKTLNSQQFHGILNSQYSAGTLNPSSSSPTAPSSSDEETSKMERPERRSKEAPRAASAHLTDSNGPSTTDLPGYMRATVVSTRCNAQANAMNTGTPNKVNPKMLRADRLSQSPYISRHRDDRDRSCLLRQTMCAHKLHRQSSKRLDRSMSTQNFFPDISKTSRCAGDYPDTIFQRGSNNHQHESLYGRQSAGDSPNTSFRRSSPSESPPRQHRGQNPGFSFSAPGAGSGPTAGRDAASFEEDLITTSPIVKRNLESAKARVLQALLSVKRSPPYQRGALIKTIVLQWHPDKHPQQDRSFATRVFQYLQDQRGKMGI